VQRLNIIGEIKYWRIEKMDFSPFIINPTLQHP